MEPLTNVRKLNPKAAVFVSRMAALKLAPLGVQFTPGAIDADEDRAARERIRQIDAEIGGLPNRIADRNERAKRADELGNERAGLTTVVGRELGVFVCPRKGEVTLGPGLQVDAAAVLEFLRGHQLHEDAPADGGTFWELAA